MDRQTIRAELDKLMIVVDEKFKQRNDITDETQIRDGLGLDSLQLTELLFEIEEGLGAKISDEEARQLRTVGDLISLIETKLKAVSGGDQA